MDEVNGTSAGDPVAFRQKQFVQLFESAEGAALELKRRAKARRFAAYSLKGVSVFGGLAVTYGLPGQWPKIVGLAISACVALDACCQTTRD